MSAVISMTTIPSRVAHIESCIASLADQGLPVYVWIQERTQRTGAVLDRVPEFMTQWSNVTATVVAERGPITKLLPVFEAGHRVVITADDDHIYGNSWARGLIAAANAEPDSVICYRGRIFDKSQCYEQSHVIKGTHRRVDILTGVDGVIYRRGFFDDSLWAEWHECPSADDIVISAHLKRRGVPILVVPNQSRITPLEIRMVDELSAINRQGGLNDECLHKLFWSQDK